MALLSLPHWRH